MDQYLCKRFLRYFILVYAVVAGLGFFIEFTSLQGQAREFNLSMIDWIVSTLLTLPQFTYEVLPIIFLLGSILTIINLVQKNEFLALESLGHKPERITISLVTFSLVFGFLFFTIIYNPLIFYSNQQHEKFFQTTEEDMDTIFHLQNQIWIKFKIGDSSAFFRAKQYNSDEGSFEDVSIFLEIPEQLNHDGIKEISLVDGLDKGSGDSFRKLEVCYAEKIRITDFDWLIEGIFYCEFEKNFQNVDTIPSRANWMTKIPTNISQEEIENLTKPEETNIFNSISIQRKLQNLGLSFRDHNIHFNTLISLPILFALMTATGVGLLPYFERKYLYLGAFLLTIFGLVMYAINNLIRSLGITQDLYPWLMAFLFPFPLAMFLSVMFGILIPSKLQIPKLETKEWIYVLLAIGMLYGFNFLICINFNWEFANNFWVIWVFPVLSLGVILMLPLKNKLLTILNQYMNSKSKYEALRI